MMKLDTAHTENSYLIGNVQGRSKRSLLPLGGQKGLNALKDDVKTLYDNKVTQTQMLNDVLSI